MTNNSTLISNVSAEELTDTFRKVVREELSAIQPKQPEQRYRTRKEVSKLLNVSLPTLDRYMDLELITYSKFGNRILFSQDDIDNALQKINKG